MVSNVDTVAVSIKVVSLSLEKKVYILSEQELPWGLLARL